VRVRVSVSVCVASGGSEGTTFKGWGQLFQALKIPRQCPLVLLVEVRLTEGKALGSE
jgi:hypothetical protein